MRAVESPPPCVLVVDDEPSVRDILARAVRSMGLLALTAASVMEALEACRLNAGRLALVLPGLNRPGPGGLTALDALRAQGPPAPVLLVTGAAELPGAGELARRGAAGVVAKPFRLRDLARAVRALLPPR